MNYSTRITWTGNRGDDTASYTSYGRGYRVEVRGKPSLEGSADPAFRGDPERHNPEDLFLASVSACHMLFYLALCAQRGIRVVGYVDEARGTLELERGGGRFGEIALHPTVTIAVAEDVERATALHHEAHQRCFLANSCSVPIRHEVTVEVRP